MKPNTSPFYQSAVKLDSAFAELQRLSERLENIDCVSEEGLSHSIKILGQYASYAQAVSQEISEFSKVFDQMRVQTELSAQAVSAKAHLIQERRKIQLELQERFRQLADKVHTVSTGVAKMREMTQDRTQSNQDPQNATTFPPLSNELEAIDSHLVQFLQEVASIQADAKNAKMRTLGRNAESLYGTLESSRKKLGTVLRH